MQFGIFTVSDVTTDPTTGHTPNDTERVQAILKIAQHAEQAGLDVFATGEHHNPPFVASSPTTMLGYIAGTTKNIVLSTATTLIKIGRASCRESVEESVDSDGGKQ